MYTASSLWQRLFKWLQVQLELKFPVKTLIAATRPEFYWQFFLQKSRKFSWGSFLNTNNCFYITEIKKHTYQIITSGKSLEDNLQLIYYLFHIENVNMIESLMLYIRQAALNENVKPKFCVPLIMNWNSLIFRIFSRNFVIFTVHNICSIENFKK